MSTKRVKGKNREINRGLTLLSFGFVIVALPVFILLSLHAYTLVFIGRDSASIIQGVTILTLMVASLGLVIFNRR